MRISKFLEEVDQANPERSKFKIALQYIDSEGQVLDSKEFDIDGVSASWRKYDDLVSSLNGDVEIEDAENEITSADVVAKAASEYHDKERAEQLEDKPGQRAADADESLDRVVNMAVDEVEDRIRKFESRKKEA